MYSYKRNKTRSPINSCVGAWVRWCVGVIERRDLLMSHHDCSLTDLNIKIRQSLESSKPYTSFETDCSFEAC